MRVTMWPFSALVLTVAFATVQSLTAGRAESADAKRDWQTEWARTVQAAEQEG